MFLVDVDECASNPCDQNATCTNHDGSFACECNSGFSGDGHSCTGMTYFDYFISIRH